MTENTDQRQAIINEIHGRIADKLVAIAECTVRDEFDKLRKRQAEEVAAQIPEVRAFIALYENLAGEGHRHDAQAHRSALMACQLFLRGGNPLSSSEIEFVQNRAKDWYAAWSRVNPLGQQVADNLRAEMQEWR